MARILIKRTNDGLLIPEKVLIEYGYVDYQDFIIRISEAITSFTIEPIDEVIDGVEG